jgi:CRP-like cAMP-binding protein
MRSGPFNPRDQARLHSQERTIADRNRGWIVYRIGARGDGVMQSAAISERRDPAAAHPIAELLACPPAIGNLLNASAECIEFEVGDVIFHQNDICQGLYVVIAGLLLRKASRLDSRLTLGTVRAGEVVELASMLSDARHTYTLVAQTKGTIMRLPKEALGRAFQSYSPLRMQLLEELAREVSRAYAMCCSTRMAGIRRRASGSAMA